MSDTRKQLVEAYFEGFRGSDHTAILALLTDDVVWDMPGFKHLDGKPAFDAEIENEQFTSSPQLTVDRMIAEGDTVVTIGEGAGTHVSGATFRFAFNDVFTFRDELIARVESYIVPLNEVVVEGFND